MNNFLHLPITITLAATVSYSCNQERNAELPNIIIIFAVDMGYGIRKERPWRTARRFYAIREGDWKYIDMLGSGGFTQPSFVDVEPGMPEGQLYNIKEDPLESNNLYFEHPEIVADLRKKIEEAKTSGHTRDLEKIDR